LSRASSANQPVGLLAAGACHGFVEQQELGRHGERDGKLERALLAVGEYARRHVGARAEADLPPAPPAPDR